MTFISTLMNLKATTKAEYRKSKRNLIMSGYRITRDYETATHFYNDFGVEVVLIKEFVNKEVAADGRT